MTALAPTDSRLAAFRKDLGANFKGFTALLPKDFPPERFARMALNAVQAVPKLLECDRGSLWLSLNNAAALGLEPNTALHECVIVPRAGKAMMQPEYRAYVKLAGNAGVSLQAGTIRKGDKIDYRYGDEGYFHFQPTPPWENEGAPAVGYYAYARTPNGPVFLVWSKKQVEDHRDKYSDSYRRAEESKKKDSPWHTAPDPMGEKTMIHAISRWLPKEIQRLSRVAEAIDSGYRVQAGAGGELEIIDATLADEQVSTEKVVEEAAKATAAPEIDEAQERLDRRREELRGKAAPSMKAPTTPPVPAEKPTPAADSAGKQESAEPEEGDGAPPEGFGIQAGDAFRLGYDKATNAIQTRGMIEPVAIHEEELRTNQGKGKEDPVCAWCGNTIHRGEQYYDGRRGVRGCLQCFPQNEPEGEPSTEDAPPPVPAGVGPSPEAQEAVRQMPAEELTPPKAAECLSAKQIQWLLDTADLGKGKGAFLVAAEKLVPGIEALDEVPADRFDELKKIALGG